jgi:hypothetical protein
MQGAVASLVQHFSKHRRFTVDGLNDFERRTADKTDGGFERVAYESAAVGFFSRAAI